MITRLKEDYVQPYSYVTSSGHSNISRKDIQYTYNAGGYYNETEEQTRVYSHASHGNPKSTSQCFTEISIDTTERLLSENQEDRTGSSQYTTNFGRTYYTTRNWSAETIVYTDRRTYKTYATGARKVGNEIERDTTNKEETYSDTESRTQTFYLYTYTTRPQSIRFTTTLAKSSCDASYKTTSAVNNGQEFVTTTDSVTAKHSCLVLTTTEGTMPSNSMGPELQTTEVNNWDLRKAFQSEIIAEEDEKIAVWSQTSTRLSMTLLDRMIKGNKDPIIGTRVASPFISSQRSYDWGNSQNQYMSTGYTQSTTAQDYYNYHTYFDPDDRTSTTYYSTSISTRAVTVNEHTLVSTTLKQDVASNGTSIKVTGFGLNTIGFGTNTINFFHSLVESIPRMAGADSYSATESETASHNTYTRTISRTEWGSTSDQHTNRHIASPIISVKTFGRYDPDNPAIQDGLGTSGTMYANFVGMMLPIMGANLATGRYNNGGIQRNFQGYAPALESPVEVATGYNVYTRTQWTYVNNAWERIETTASSAVTRVDTVFTFSSNLPEESVIEAYKMALTTYKYDSTSDGNSDSSFWQQRTNEITAVTLATIDSNYHLGSAEYAVEDPQYVSTSYAFESTMEPLFAGNDATQFRDENNKALNWFSGAYIKNNVFVCGGIDPIGEPKTAYIYQYRPEDTYSLIEYDSNGSANFTLDKTGLSLEGKEVTTYINRDDYEVTMGDDGANSYAQNQPTFSLYYKQHETTWSHSLLSVHPWNIPYGGSYGYGIVTKIGQPPATSASTLNPDADASLHSTIKAYEEPVMPQTVSSEQYLSESVFHTQDQVPFIN